MRHGLLLLLLIVPNAPVSAEPQWTFLGLGGRETRALVLEGADFFAGTESGVFTKPWGSLDTTWTGLGPDSLEVETLLFLDSQTLLAGGAARDGDGLVVERMYRSEDRGMSWASVPTPSGITEIYSLDSHPSFPDTVFASGAGSCLKSVDLGASWIKSYPNYALLNSVRVSRQDPSTVWTGGEGFFYSAVLFRSTNGGVSWSPDLSPHPSSENAVNVIQFDSVNPDLIYLGMESFFEKSEDGGSTWNPTLNVSQFYFHAIELDPRRPATLYMTGSAIQGLPAPGLNLYVSGDRGDSWTYFNHQPAGGSYRGWALVPVVEGDSVAVYVGAQGGVYRVGYFETVGVNETPPGTSTVLAPPRVGPGSASIRYTLARATPVDLAIYDVSGRLVRVLEHGHQEPGDHERTWRLDSDSGRTTAAGVYFIRLEAGGEIHTRKAVIAKR